MKTLKDLKIVVTALFGPGAWVDKQDNQIVIHTGLQGDAPSRLMAWYDEDEILGPWLG